MKNNKKAIFPLSLALVVLVGGCFWAGSKTGILSSFKKMLPDPWFKITLLDLYIGFGLFCAYIGYREKSIVKTSLWAIAMAGLGNIVTLFYLILAFYSNSTRSILEAKREKWTVF